MPDDVMPQAVSQLFLVYGPAALPIIGLLLIIKYLLDKDKQREIAYAAEIKEERIKIDLVRQELLTEARGNAKLAEELKKTLQVMASRSPT